MIRDHRIIQAPFPLDLLFEIAQDVENYPQFLPHCVAARIHEKKEDHWVVDNVYQFGPIQQKFTTWAVIKPTREIDIRSTPHDPIQIHVHWAFSKNEDDQSIVRFEIGLKSRLPMVEKVGAHFIEQSATQIEDAFMKRASELHSHHAN